jgi:cytochrome c biogenesis protein CcdA
MTAQHAAAGPPSREPALVRYGKSSGIGAAFAVGWTPCIGPILGAILTMAAASATVAQGAFLLAAWSLGLGVPFLLAGMTLGSMMAFIRKVRPLMPVFEIVGGLLVIFIGALIFLDEFTIFNQYFSGGVSNVTESESNLTGIGIEGAFGFVAAFLAGIVAFLSPCVLPMVPAYIMLLAGASAAAPEGEQRATTLRHAVAFVLGFSVVFVALGASVGAVGYVVRDNMEWIEKAAGVLLIILGLNLLGILRIPWLYRTYQFDFPTGQTVE